MSKKLLEEGTIKRWKKLAGLNEADMKFRQASTLGPVGSTSQLFGPPATAQAAASGGGQTSDTTYEKVKEQQIARIRPKLKDALKDKVELEPEQFDILLGMIHGGRSSYVRGLEAEKVPEVTIDELKRRLENIKYEIDHAKEDSDKKTLMDLHNKIKNL